MLQLVCQWQMRTCLLQMGKQRRELEQRMRVVCVHHRLHLQAAVVLLCV